VHSNLRLRPDLRRHASAQCLPPVPWLKGRAVHLKMFEHFRVSSLAIKALLPVPPWDELTGEMLCNTYIFGNFTNYTSTRGGTTDERWYQGIKTKIKCICFERCKESGEEQDKSATPIYLATVKRNLLHTPKRAGERCARAPGRGQPRAHTDTDLPPLAHSQAAVRKFTIKCHWFSGGRAGEVRAGYFPPPRLFAATLHARPHSARPLRAPTAHSLAPSSPPPPADGVDGVGQRGP
jgi:hypothetical protein